MNTSRLWLVPLPRSDYIASLQRGWMLCKLGGSIGYTVLLSPHTTVLELSVPEPSPPTAPQATTFKGTQPLSTAITPWITSRRPIHRQANVSVVLRSTSKNTGGACPKSELWNQVRSAATLISEKKQRKTPRTARAPHVSWKDTRSQEVELGSWPGKLWRGRNGKVQSRWTTWGLPSKVSSEHHPLMKMLYLLFRVFFGGGIFRAPL